MVSELRAYGLRVWGPAGGGGRRWRRCRRGVLGIDVMLIFFDTFTAVSTYVRRGL